MLRKYEYVIYTNITNYTSIIDELVEVPNTCTSNTNISDAKSIFNSIINTSLNFITNYHNITVNTQDISQNYNSEIFRKKYFDEIKFKINLPSHFNPEIIDNVCFRTSDDRNIIFILTKMNMRYYFAASNMPFNRGNDIGIASILEHRLSTSEFENYVMEHRNKSNIQSEIIKTSCGETIDILKYNTVFNGHIETSLKIVCDTHNELFFQVSINR